MQEDIGRILEKTDLSTGTLDTLECSVLGLQETLERCQSASDLPSFYEEWLKEVR